jgi:heme exporter protein A
MEKTERQVAEPKTQAAPAVETAGLSRRYGRRWVLWDIDWSVPVGCAALVAGHNGAGKSTLFRILATAIRADRGRAVVAGHDVARARHSARRATALLSHASYLYEALTARENLEITLRLLGRPAERATIDDLLETTRLIDRADDPVATFSAGMRKRLALGRVLAQAAQVVLLDEPYGQLDPAGFRLVDDTVRRLRSAGATVLMATHQLERASVLCDLGLVLERGQVRWRGPAARLPREGGLDSGGLPEGVA